MYRKQYIKPLTESMILVAENGLLTGSEIEIDGDVTTEEQFSRTQLLFFMADSD